MNLVIQKIMIEKYYRIIIFSFFFYSRADLVFLKLGREVILLQVYLN